MSPRIRGLRAGRAWFRARPTAADAALALLLIAVGLPQALLDDVPADGGWAGPDARQVVLLVAAVGVLALRRRFPLLVLAAVVAALVALTVWRYPPAVPDVAALLVAVYGAGAYRPLAQGVLGGVLAVAALAVVLVLAPESPGVMASLTYVLLVVGVWVLGRNLRMRRVYFAELEDRAARLERARGTDARAARIEERSRIARELHDVVAHHVSVMTVQAGAARRVIDRNPAGAREAMSTIEEVGRTALSEMRRIVGVLRTDRDEGDGGELAPQPGLGDVGELLEHVRETGLQVQLWIEGEARTPSPGVDVAAFRLVQEALTNTLKHAGPAARAWVRLNYGERDLTVEIEDDGHGTATISAQDEDRPGHGLVGMYERVALFGGELRIGPRVGGGFGVRARFPLEP